jgi:hypothetical protein
MRQSRSERFTPPPLDLAKTGQANATLEKENTDPVQPGVRSVEIGYFPHLIRSTVSINCPYRMNANISHYLNRELGRHRRHDSSHIMKPGLSRPLLLPPPTRSLFKKRRYALVIIINH